MGFGLRRNEGGCGTGGGWEMCIRFWPDGQNDGWDGQNDGGGAGMTGGGEGVARWVSACAGMRGGAVRGVGWRIAVQILAGRPE